MSSSRRKGILNKNMISPGYKVQTISTNTYLPPSLHMWGVDVGIYNRWEAFWKEVKLMTQAADKIKWLLSRVIVEKHLNANK